MTELIKYSQIGAQDLNLGTGTFQVTLADGRVVTLDQVNLDTFFAVGSSLPFKVLTTSLSMSGYATFAEAVAGAGSQTCSILVPAPATISSNLTVPSTATLVFQGQGLLTISSGITLTINGPLQAPLKQIFAGSGTVAGPPQAEAIHPEWWGAQVGGVVDSSTGIQAALTLGGCVELQTGTYLITTALTMGSNVTLRGNGKNVTIIKGNLSGPLLKSTNQSTRFYRWTIQDVGFDNTSKSTSGGMGIDLKNISVATVSNVTIQNVETGLNFDGTGGGCLYNHLRSVEVLTVVTGAVFGTTANENAWIGGRINDCTTGIDFTTSNTSNTIDAVAFEVFTTGIKDASTGVCQYNRSVNCRFENTPTTGTGISLSADSQAFRMIAPTFIGLSTNYTTTGTDYVVVNDTDQVWGGGSSIRRIAKFSATIDFGNISANTVSDSLVAVTGAATTDHWFVTPDSTIGTGLMVMAIPASGGVYIRMANITTGAIDPPSLSFALTQIKYN